MIASQDRSYWIGASDTSYVVGNWTTASFRTWWQSKLGMNFKPKFNNKYTRAGTHYEHKILDTIPFVEMDTQILFPEIGLRVNYDGIVGKSIKEVKTYKADKEFKVSKTYWRQAQVEMFAADTTDLEILAYPMTEDHYKNYFIPVDPKKIGHFPVEYDQGFIEGEFLPKLIYLKHCMDIGAFPKKEEYIKWQDTKRNELKQQISLLRSNRQSSCVTVAGVSSVAMPTT